MNLKHQYLTKALELAQQRQGFCAPNPAVGAVIVRNDQIIAEAMHWAAGHPHAEIVALNQLTVEQTRGASLYVTLEPCCHHGKTPPCTEAIIAAGITHVFYAYQDPNPVVSGQGIEQLRSAGIVCEYINHESIQTFYKGYAHWHTHKNPYTTVKLALSADGKIAGPNYQSVRMTGEAAEQLTHQYRKQSDAILTTAKTIICDNPQLNVRLNDTAIKKPIYILDRNLSLIKNLTIYNTAESITIFYDQALSKPAEFQDNIKYVAMPLCDNHLDLNVIFEYIGKSGIHHLWVEVGGVLLENLLQEKLVQKLLIYKSRKVLGEEAISGFHKNTEWIKLVENVHWQALGEDTLCEIEF